MLKSINNILYHGFKNHMPKIICVPLSFAELKKAAVKDSSLRELWIENHMKKHEIVLILGLYWDFFAETFNTYGDHLERAV